ncbi:unnamed protein product [Rhizophagus irregularis]|nr:unnamed protein product [Rhizophagus irregularis]
MPLAAIANDFQIERENHMRRFILWQADGKFIFNKPNIPPQLFIIFLRFIYCGKIDLTNLLGFEWCLAQHSNVPQGRRFSVSGYARIGTDEDLATARLYFKRPGRIRRLFLDNWTHRTSGLEIRMCLVILKYIHANFSQRYKEIHINFGFNSDTTG